MASGRARLGGDDAARFDTVVMLGELLARSAAWLFAHDDAEVDAATAARFGSMLERRATGEPVAYIVGEVGFYGRRFSVSPAVLVPRPESEAIVTLVLERFADRSAPLRFCDVGTGSGALAVSLACAYDRANVVALDVSPAALSVAARNAARHGVAANVACRESDLLAACAGSARFDAIVANLPYVATADLRPRPDPTGFEPRLALDGGPDGLDPYRALLAQIRALLADRGLLVMEAGPGNAAALAALAARAFPSYAVRTHADLAGLARLVEVRREPFPAPPKTARP